MAYYMQWLSKFPERKRLVYICGKEKFLVNEVYEAEIKSRIVPITGLISLDGAEVPIEEIELELNQYGGDRLIIIKNADQIKNWSGILKWTESRYMRNTSLICVGNENLPVTTEARYRPFVEKRDTAKFIECKSLSLEQTLEYIALKGDFTHDAKNDLYVSCDGNLSRISSEIKKLNYLGCKITREMIHKYVPVSITDNFVSKLFERTYKLEMVKLIAEKDIPLIIAGIEYNLTCMLLLVRNLSRDVGFRDLSEITGIPIFLIGKLVYWCKGVTEVTIIRRLKLLANLDVAYRKGNIIGALEKFLILW